MPSFLRSFYTHDIPAPDVGTNEKIMDWMVGEYKTIHPGENYLGSFTGKSIDNGGARGRREATGKGTYYSYLWLVNEWAKNRVQNDDVIKEQNQQVQYQLIKKLYEKSDAGEPITVAVQGFGNVGSVAALEAAVCDRLRHHVVSVSDQHVTLYNENGLEVQRLIQFANQNGRLPHREDDLKAGGIEAQILPRESILTLQVDVLILAAVENQITSENMKDVKADVFVEGANAPISSEADHYLNNEGKVIIPDILANAGGVIVSYLEWKQDRVTQLYTEQEVFEEMYEHMSQTFAEVYDQYFLTGLKSLRKTCYINAVRRLMTLLYKHGKLY